MPFELCLIAQQYVQPAPGQGGGIGIGFFLILGATMIVSMLVSGVLKSRFTEYSRIPVRMTGAQVAEEMLRQNGIRDVKVVSVRGQLTDHYDPVKKTVNLSEPVYHVNSVAAAAVAAHECGHALQHQQAYAWLNFRSKMVPAVQIASNLQQFFLMFGIGGLFLGSPALLWVWVAVFGVTTLFALVTLPVEFDASRRALVWLERSGMAGQMEHQRAKSALFWAAVTYVVAALGAVAQLLYLVMTVMGSRRDN